MSQPEQCSIGNEKDEECHKKSYTRQIKLLNFSDLAESEKKIILMRLETKAKIQTICLHHHECLLRRYEGKHRSCSDPFAQHKNPRRGGLTAITLHLTESAQALLSLNLVPGKKLCPTCRKKVVDSIKKKEETSSEEEVESEDGEMSMVEMEYERQQACNQLSDCFNTIGVSPIKTHSRPKRSQVKQGQKKIKAVMTSISDKVAKSLNVPIESVIPPSKAEKLNKELEQKAKDFDELMQALAEKVKSLKDRRLKMQILTLVPSSWSMKKTEEFFKVSNYMVRAARKLVQEKGILALPDEKVDGQEAVGDEEMDEQEIFAIPNETVNETGILAISDEEE